MTKLKFIFISMFFAFASVGWGVTEKSSWARIVMEPGIFPLFPQVLIHSTYVPVTSVCVNGDQFFSKVEDCVAWKWGSEEFICAETKLQTLSVPILSAIRVCVEFDVSITEGSRPGCLKYELVQPKKVDSLASLITFQVPVYTYGLIDNIDKKLVFTKPYTVRNCILN